MCGLAGIVTFDERYRLSGEVLEAMVQAVAHRGPDGRGVWINHASDISRETPQAGLVHCRLAIIDPDPRANQPFTDGRGRWLVFNGEIYNYRELRPELAARLPDYAWRTRSDTEVLLAAYAAWGEKCIDHLNGMYAFAVWDEQRKSMFLARDRLGQKPLYIAYLQHDGQWARAINGHDGLGTPAAVAFASELEALKSLPWFDRTLESGAVQDYLQWGYCLPNQTIYRGARFLPPGNWLRVSAAGAGGHTHAFSSSQPVESRSDADARVQTRRLVQQAVQRQMVADVPIGCFLSGGVDSSIVAACMKQAAGSQRVMTFSIGFDDPRYDETGYAREVAQHLGTEHHEFIVQPDAAADLPRLAKVFGEPFGDSSALPTHYLARETRQHVKVALAGDGGDELFCGYDRYRAMKLGRRLRSIVGGRTLRGLATMSRWLPGVHPRSRLARLKRLLASVAQPDARRYAAYLRLFDDGALHELLAGTDLAPVRPLDDAVETLMSVYLHPRAAEDPVRAAMAVDRQVYLPCDLLTKVDRASMLHALEVRSPFMDHELVAFAAGLSTRQLLAGGPKRMLREAFSDRLPARVFTRRKMGFAVPIGEWFRSSLRDLLRGHLFAASSFARSHLNIRAVERLVDEHDQNRADHTQRLYALLMLELWWGL